MAKKRLKIKDKQGNIVNYDISSASVTIDVEGKTLDVKLTELVAAIQAAVNTVVYNGTPHYVNNSIVDLGSQIQPDWAESATSYPSYIRNKPDVVTGIKVGEGGETITPTGGIITLPNSGGQVTDADTEMSDTSENAVQNKVIKAYVDGLIQGLQNVLNTITQDGATQGVIDTFNEVKAFLEGISSSDTLAAKLLLKQDALVAGNGIVIGTDGKTVSVDAEVVQPVTADGTFSVRIGGNTYTINLNHSHPQYVTAQLLKAGSNVSISVNQQTGEVTINAAGGSGGTITSITMNGAAVSVNNGVANLGNVVTPQSLASEGFAKIVKTTQAAYDALTPKDENTLYIIPYLGSSKAGKTYLGRDLIWEYEPPFAVPYDAVVEYLESTGTQYFDTGIIENTRNFEVTLEAAWTGTNSNQTEILFGYMAYPAEPQYPNFQIYKSQGKWGFSPTNANILTDISIDHNKHTFFVTENETANTADVSIDGGTPTRLTTNDYGIATNTLHHFIGGRSENDGFFQRSSSARFYRLNYKKFADAAHQTLIKEWNFIPVRVENVGYMYDTISKQLYSAQGGAFIVGNDITT